MAADAEAAGRAVSQRVQMGAADDLDARAAPAFDQPREMGIFRQHAAEIVPHAGDDRLARRRVHVRERPFQIDPRTVRNREARPELPAQRAAQRRGAVHRQQGEQAEQRAHQRIFAEMAQGAERGPAPFQRSRVSPPAAAARSPDRRPRKTASNTAGIPAAAVPTNSAA